MRLSLISLTVLFVSPPALLQACETTGHSELALSTVAPHCHPWPSCTAWAPESAATARVFPVAGETRTTDSVDVLVGEFDLANGEFVRVHLERGKIYRIEFASPSGILRIRPRDRSAEPVLPLTIEDIPRASGTQAMEIAPRADGEYEFVVSGTGGTGARLRVYREIEPSARWQRIASR